MGDWTSGYVADIAYTYGYYGILNPLKVKLAFLNKGLLCPEFVNACELGFGQGLSTNIHAAASTVQWYGTDFNPAQASFAQELNKASEAGARLYDESFEEFARRDDLPEFDYIGLHGIWTWVSDENRAIIVDFIRRKLRVGGVLYISYNTQPGWAGSIPLRHLMTQHASLDSRSAGIVNQVDNAIDFVDRMFKVNPGYLKAQPAARERLELIKGQDRSYIAHEYFNKDWKPMFFDEMAQYLEPCKVEFACSAEYTEHVAGLNLTAEQQAFLADIKDPIFKESSFDFMINQLFRRDYWVKGARELNALERTEALQKLRIMLSSPRDEVSLKAKGALGEGDMSAHIYEPILALLAGNKVTTLGLLEAALSAQGISLAHIVEATLVLAGMGYVCLVQDEAAIVKARKKTDRLNAAIMDKARGSEDLKYLASPVSGGGVAIGRFQLLFAHAYSQGKKTPEAWVSYAWTILSAQNQKIIKDKKVLESDADNLQELGKLAQEFSHKTLPVLKALQVI